MGAGPGDDLLCCGLWPSRRGGDFRFQTRDPACKSSQSDGRSEAETQAQSMLQARCRVTEVFPGDFHAQGGSVGEETAPAAPQVSGTACVEAGSRIVVLLGVVKQGFH